MDHIYQNEEFGENWFGYEKLYDYFIEKTPNNGIIVEVGCWKGKSISYLAVENINSGKNIKIYAVDTWEGSGNVHDGDKYVQDGKLYDLFLSNISTINRVITPIRATSFAASYMFEDNSIDAVFIDANHEYEYVKQDIEKWFPKVKPGGIISGHDYSPIEQGNGHPGVRRAVHEIIGENNIIVYPANCWVHLKK